MVSNMPDNPPTKRKEGHPTTYTLETASKICDLLAEGMLLKDITKLPDMPGPSTVYSWLHRQPEFVELYARARETQMDGMVEEILAIADEFDADPQRARLRVDTRKWIMSKLAAKRFGDRVQQIHTGADGGAVKVEQISPLEEIEDRLKRLSERSEPVAEPKATLQ